MLSLTPDSVREFWVSQSPELAELLISIERTEDWTVDSHPDIAERLAQLGLLLSDPQATARLEGADKNDLLFFLVYISSSKALRLIKWMDDTHAGLGSRLLSALLEQNGSGVFANVADPMLAGTLIQRLRVIQNSPFFEKLLSPALLDSIVRAIDSYRDERKSHEA